MNGKVLFAAVAVLLVVGSAVGHDTEDINRLKKEKQLAIVDELIHAQKQIDAALKRILKKTDHVSTHHEGSHEASDESNESNEENEWEEVKQKKISEMREQIFGALKNIGEDQKEVERLIDVTEHKIEEKMENSHEEVNYNLYYHKKPHHHHHHRHSSEESDEHFYYKKKPVRRGGRQLTDPEDVIEEEPQPQEVVKTVDGEEVVQTLPVAE